MGVPEPLLIANIEKEETQCARTLYSSPSVSMSSADDTNTDLGVLKELHSEHAVGTYDVTVVTRPRKKLKIVEQGRSQPRAVDGLAVEEHTKRRKKLLKKEIMVEAKEIEKATAAASLRRI